MKLIYKSKVELDEIKLHKNVLELKNNWNIGAELTKCTKRNKKDLRLIIRDKKHKKCNGKILYFTFYNVNEYLKQTKVTSIVIKKTFFKNLENEISKEMILNTLISVFEHENKREVMIEQ